MTQQDIMAENQQHDMESETIKFNELEGQDGFVIQQATTLLNIFPSRANQKITNSSKVKLTNIVDYSWDAQSGIGRLTSSHYSGNYIAYCVKVGGVGAVRVVNLDTKDRVLMRGTRGLIRDVEFIHKSDELVLGFIDEYGTFYIYKILKNQKMETLLLLQVELEGSPRRLECRRFIWCRHVPDDGGDSGDSDNAPAPVREPPAYQFAIIEDDMVYVANVISFLKKYGEGVHAFPTLVGGYLTIREHTESVVDASFSPDGTAIATASKDGTVKFFQIYWLLPDADDPRCLYSWAPHDGEPVSKIFFLDDHTLHNNTESQYWKFVLTAGPNMNEIKLWNCMKWECIQTLRFSIPSPSSMRMDMNMNAKFLILADSQRQVMYVINLEHDDDGARFSWINEFSIPVPVLGFNICSVEFCNMRKVQERGFEHFVSDDVTTDVCVVDIIFVQPKSLMQASMAFRPPTERVNVNGRTHSRISFDDSVSFKHDDEKDDEIDDEEVEEEDMLEPPPKARRSLTPKSTTRIPSPRSQLTNKSRESPRPSTSPSPRKSGSTSVSHLTQQLSSLIGVGLTSPGTASRISHLNPFPSRLSLEDEASDATLPIRVRTSSTNGNLSNASSSPSREVEEILSPKNSDTFAHKSDVAAYHLLDTGFGANPLDIQGNIIDKRDITQKMGSPITKSPTHLVKANSLGGNELMGPQIPQVLEQVNSIMDMMKAQAQELRELRNEVNRLNNAQLLGSRQMDEIVISRCMDKYTALQEANLRRLEESFNASLLHLEKRGGIPKSFTEDITLDLAHAIKTEIDSSVVPQLLKIFEPVCLHLNSEVQSLIRGAEVKVKQQMGQMVNSHEFKSMLRDQVSGAVKGVCDGAMSDVFCTSVCPSFEKSLQGLFGTINETFMKGTKEYMVGVESSVSASRSQHEEIQDSINRQFMCMQDTLSSILQVELESQMRLMMQGIHEGLFAHFEESISQEIQRAFQEQQKFFEVSVIPRTATPAPPICDSPITPSQSLDPAVRLAQLRILVESGDIVGAFTKAANIADHGILMALAQKVTPTLVFTKELSTVVHLSIIQQMATDISTFTDTKLLYLQTAIGTLNLADPKVLRSLSRIIPVFQSSVTRFATLNPESPLIGNLKFLEMAFVGIGNRCQQQQQLTPTSAYPRSQR